MTHHLKRPRTALLLIVCIFILLLTMSCSDSKTNSGAATNALTETDTAKLSETEPAETEAQPVETEIAETEKSQETETEDTVRIIDPTKPMIALTFDDGPREYSDRLLDLLKKHDVKVTFFVLGRLAERNSNSIKRIVAEGHEIGNHTWDHNIKFTEATDEDIKLQITAAQDAITKLTGKDCLYVRPPVGAINEHVQEIGKELGVSFIKWTYDTTDWGTTDANGLYIDIITRVKDRDLILCHEVYPSTIEAMERVIPRLLSMGYQFVTVSELLEYTNVTLEPGDVYPPES